MSIVAIVGRPNVGKSTIFNRFTESKNAITYNISGTTRDRNYGECVWNGKSFTLIDTGGYIDDNKNSKNGIFSLNASVNNQIKLAIDESDVILFVVDAKDGLLDSDKEFAKIIRKYKGDKHVILIVNKADNEKLDFAGYEFLQLGFDNIFKISAANGIGTGDLLDDIVNNLKEKDINNNEGNKNLPRFAIIGQPNVGKSSLLNVLLGNERSIVNDESGTTRDSIDSLYNLYNKKFILVDTAGIRKKNKEKEDIEFYSTLRSLKSLENCDICLYIIDATLGIENEDQKLINLAIKYKKGIVIIVNKWDLIEKDSKTANIFRKKIYEKLKSNNFIPIIFISALKKNNIFKVVEKGLEIYENKNKKIKTSELNDKLLPIITSNPPSSSRGREIKIKYITQLPTENIIFAFFCNRPDDINSNYRTFLKNKIYELFDFTGIPIQLIFRSK